MFKRKCKITFITHGATVHTLDGILCDTEKYPKLNEFGEEEIAKVCKYLEERAVHYDTIYTSPSARCTQSAQIIAKLFRKNITTLALPGRKWGEFSGQPFSEIVKSHGIDSMTKKINGGEDLKDFNKRVSDVIDELIEINRGNRIIIVTTPDVVQAAIAKTLELKPNAQFKILIKTGSLTQISYFEGDWSSIIYSDLKPY